MSEFFESEIVREELEEINKMQQKIYGSMMTFAELDSEEKLEHINALIDLLERQKVMYTRVSLSDDPKAIELKAQLHQSVSLMGLPPNTSMNVLFDTMSETIQNLKKFVDV